MAILKRNGEFLTKCLKVRVILNIIGQLGGPLEGFPESFMVISGQVTELWTNVQILSFLAHCVGVLPGALHFLPQFTYRAEILCLMS